MNKDFHYYATYSAAILAGYSHEESLAVCGSDFFVDLCTKTLLSSVGGPLSAATTQLAMELAEEGSDPISLQEITRIWASFHFLPRDLHAEKKHCGRLYRQKYRLICGPNSDLLVRTINNAKELGNLQATGLAMHVLCDTWAHSNFAGTPSLVINNTNRLFFEVLCDGTEKPIQFKHNPGAPDDLTKGTYVNSVYRADEYNVMNLGHGRAGHLPDYSFMTFKYLPAWGNYEYLIKDNPSDYMHAYCQMVYAMKYLRDAEGDFKTGVYDEAAVAPYRSEIDRILRKRQTDSSEDWKAFGERLSGETIPAFDPESVRTEYAAAAQDEKDQTFLGRFILAALQQKGMVTDQIFRSGNLLAGYSVNKKKWWTYGIKDFRLLTEAAWKGDAS